MTDTLECGCRIVRKLALQEIEYCPMHQAAKQMLEALKDVIEQADKTSMMLPADLADSIHVFGRAAIAKATGG